jgi:hypothetical protein
MLLPHPEDVGSRARSSKMLVSYHTTSWCHNPEDSGVNLHIMKISHLAKIKTSGPKRVEVKQEA